MAKRVSKAVASNGGLAVTVDGTEKSFSWLWLRDHSQEPECFHQQARQRLLETFRLGPVGRADKVEVDEAGGRLTLRWQGNHVSRFNADYLAAVTAPDRLYDVTGADRTLWDASNAAELSARVEHDDFVNDDGLLAEMLRAIHKVGMISLKNVPSKIAATRRVMERIAYIRSSIFGEIWEVKSSGEMADTGYTPLEIKPHSDGTYNHDAPGLMCLHCLQYEAAGGDNVLVDGFNIARVIEQSHPQAYRLLSTVPIPGQYVGDGAYLVARRPVFRRDESERLIQVSFNNHDRAPFHLPEPRMAELYEALGVFDRLVQDPAHQFVFGQRPGDMVIFDNWRLLHGRHAFEGERHLAGAYINREDFESRLRVLSDQPMDMVGKP